MNVNCDCNKNVCEAITITFPITIMKHDMNKFNVAQSECRIQNLINLLVNRKSSMCFSCLCHSKYHKSIMPPLQCVFFLMMCAFSYERLFSVSIFYQQTSEKNEVYTGNLTHCRQTQQLINPLTPMSDQSRISPNNIDTISIR